MYKSSQHYTYWVNYPFKGYCRAMYMGTCKLYFKEDEQNLRNMKKMQEMFYRSIFLDEKEKYVYNAGLEVTKL